jgi:hypothetical protein
VNTHQVPLQLYGQTKGLPHHDTRHGTIEMMDASDEDGSDLRCPSTPVAPWQALGVLLPRGDLPWAWQ